MDIGINFMPTCKCPHCGATIHPAISGWGREGLNIRFKWCYHCNQEYKVIAYIETVTNEIDDCQIRELKERIKDARKKRRVDKDKLILKYSSELIITDRTELSN